MFALRSRFAAQAQAAVVVPALALALALAAGAAEAPLPGPIPARVERVIDGDTLTVRARIWLEQDVRANVRLADVDAPELRRAGCAQERARALAARDRVLAAVGEGAVELFEVRPDKYGGRVVARVRTADGRDLSGVIENEGLAVPLGEAAWCPLAPSAAKP